MLCWAVLSTSPVPTIYYTPVLLDWTKQSPLSYKHYFPILSPTTLFSVSIYARGWPTRFERQFLFSLTTCAAQFRPIPINSRAKNNPHVFLELILHSIFNATWNSLFQKQNATSIFFETCGQKNKMISAIFILLTFGSIAAIPVDPSTPELVKDDIGDDYFNVSFIPGKFDPEKQAPVGNLFHIKYRESGDSDWMVHIFY